MTEREKMNLSQASQANLETLERLRNDKVFISMGMCGSKKDKILTFVDQKKFLKTAIENINISVLLVSNDLYDDLMVTNKECHIILAEDPRQVFYEYHNYLARHIEVDEIDTQVGTSSQISQYAYVADHGVIIGDRVVIEPNVTILPGVTIGDGSIIRSGSTIGVEGFEHKRLRNGLILSVIHDSNVVIGREVEIGGNNTVAKGFMGQDTKIGDFTKTDCLVHIGHCAQIGARCLIPACAMIAGSTIIGDDVWIGPNASISSSLKIGNGAFVTLGSVVVSDVEENARVSGNFAIDHFEFKRKMRS